MSTVDLNAIRADLEYASSGIDGADMPYHPHALHAMRAAETLLAEVDRAHAETQEIAAELAEERTLHQRTLAEVKRLRRVRAELAAKFRGIVSRCDHDPKLQRCYELAARIVEEHETGGDSTDG